MRFPKPVDRETEKELRDLLREADPVREHGDLPSREADRLRRTMLAEAERSRPVVPLAWLGAAAGILLLIGVGWTVWSRGTPETETRSVTAAVPVPPPDVAESGGIGERVPEAAVPSPVPRDRTSRPGTSGSPGQSSTITGIDAGASIRRGAETPETVSSPGETEAIAEAVAARERGGGEPDQDRVIAREIRFETEGGTRLIWIFEKEPSMETDKGVTS